MRRQIPPFLLKLPVDAIVLKNRCGEMDEELMRRHGCYPNCRGERLNSDQKFVSMLKFRLSVLDWEDLRSLLKNDEAGVNVSRIAAEESDFPVAMISGSYFAE